MSAASSIEILGVRVDDVTNDEMLATVHGYVASRQPHQIVTLNSEMLVAAWDDPGFRRLLNSADLNVADGVGLMMAARWLGHPLRERVTGSDGIYRLAEHCARMGYRPFFLGAASGVADAVAGRLAACYPGLNVAGAYAGSPCSEDEDDVVSRVQIAAPDMLFVAYGVPAEERWIARNRDRLAVPVMIGVGGAFDFVAGVTSRAPLWMRQAGLEWLYRLIRQPWRWRRQLALIRFVALVLRSKLSSSRGASNSKSG
jgi:N-acetylglucosaminyldiphosphoundecaprenol N-acetyl-beta-D-mannosaminyltransferase